MYVYYMRHGQDYQNTLTPKGAVRVALAADTLAAELRNANVSDIDIASSPQTRAVVSAGIVQYRLAEIGIESGVTVDDKLDGAYLSIDKFLDEQVPGSCLIVIAHEPNIAAITRRHLDYAQWIGMPYTWSK